MNELKNYIRKLKSFTIVKQEKELFDIVYSNRDYIVDLNTQQLLDGKTSEGGFVQPPYRSVNYAEFKLHLNPKGVVDLHLTGAFHNSFFVKVDGWPIVVWATDSKTDELVEKYSDEIFGPDKTNVKKIAEYNKPEFRDYYRKLLSIR